MRLRVTVEIPASATPKRAKVALLSAGITGEGITLRTAKEECFDVEVVNVEDVTEEVLK